MVRDVQAFVCTLGSISNLSKPVRVQSNQQEILAEPALTFLAALHRTFNATRLAVSTFFSFVDTLI